MGGSFLFLTSVARRPVPKKRFGFARRDLKALRGSAIITSCKFTVKELHG
jgi:hypothetical protein